MLSLRGFAAVTLPLLLTACYTSPVPLITPAQAVFPYETITYSQSGGKPQLLTHMGNAYISVDEKGNAAEMLFMPVTAPYYVAQLHVKTDGGDGYLFGFLKLDLAAKTASAYAIVADKTDIGPGLPACPGSDDTVCLTTLAPYVTHAMALAASKKPDTVYILSDLK